MKTLLAITLTSILFVSCQNDDGYGCDNGNCIEGFAQYPTQAECESYCGGSGGSAGYNCVSDNCVSVSSNAQYSTYSACQSSCAVNNSPGSVTISASWTNSLVSCTYAYTVSVGLGYTSNDVANEAYFATGLDGSSPLNYIKNNLSPGVYYYKLKKTFNVSVCGTGSGTPPVVTRSGSFTITPGEMTTVFAGILN